MFKRKLLFVSVVMICWALAMSGTLPWAMPQSESETAAVDPIKRAVFTSGIEDREPVDALDSLSTDSTRVFFFTEIMGMQGRTVTHRWMLNDDAMAALARLRERAEMLGSPDPEHYIFPACESGHIDPTRHQKSWRTAWRSLTVAAGLKGFRFHDLRHTAITELAEARASDATLMALAGHLSPHMTEHYSHVRMQAKREAVEKLNSGLMGKPIEDPVGVEKLN